MGSLIHDERPIWRKASAGGTSAPHEVALQSPEIPPHAAMRADTPTIGRRFFLDPKSTPGEPRLAPDDARHASTVLRLAEGERILGLDGAGLTFPLRVAEAARRTFRVEADGEPEREPEPGDPSAALPWIELAVAWPKAARGEEMLGRLVQLGAMGITPLITKHSGPRSAPSPGDGRMRRLERIAREACKQSRRSWLPTIRTARTTEELGATFARGSFTHLDPGAQLSFAGWAHAAASARIGNSQQPLLLCIGPEGGFTTDEIQSLRDAGSKGTNLHPNILRIETAAEAALAILSAIWIEQVNVPPKS